MKNKKGFTLVELMTALVVTSFIVIILFSILSFQQKTSRHQEQLFDLIQDFRWVVDTIGSKIRLSGYGVPASSLNYWITWATITSPLMITDGGISPDAILITGAFDRSYPFDSGAPRLTAAANAGGTELQVSSVSFFNTSNKKLIFIGGQENALVTGITGSKLTIDTNPYISGNQGLLTSYASNTPVEVVKTIKYYIGSGKLLSLDIDGTVETITENVEDLQFSLSGDVVSMSVRLRSGKKEPDYKDGIYNDGYIRTSQKTSILIRNNLIK